MTHHINLVGIVFFAVFLCASGTSAQMFGQRKVGRPLAQQSGASGGSAAASRAANPANRTTAGTGGSRPGAESRPSLVSEDARFIRGNRAASDFVGAVNPESQQFVGLQELDVSAEEIRSAVDDLQIETGPDANRIVDPVMPARVRMYAPRLQLGFPTAPTPTVHVNARLARRLETTLPIESSSQIEVLVAGDAAILRGVVASERDRKMAELLLQFEPGIARVQNELQLQAAAAPPMPVPPKPAPMERPKAPPGSPD